MSSFYCYFLGLTLHDFHFWTGYFVSLDLYFMFVCMYIQGESR